MIHHGNALEVLRTMESESVDACVTDPPYELGFMGKSWDRQGVAFKVELWAEVLRVLKPGAHLLAFGGTRTFHRMVCAIEDADFEIRDTIAWLYGSGFPKSLDVTKAIDKHLGDTRPVVGSMDTNTAMRGGKFAAGSVRRPREVDVTSPGSAQSAQSAQWQGYGTALKPALEPICVARKPLAGTVATNVLEHGTGALNIDACRIQGEAGDGVWGSSNKGCQDGRTFNGSPTGEEYRSQAHELGRWPANVVHDGSDEVLAAFPETQSGKPCGSNFAGGNPVTGFGDSGSAARFFYCAKASADERPSVLIDGKTLQHPTVKPESLMAWLVQLVCPEGGLVLDPFAGSGTTLAVAKKLGRRWVGIELNAEYIELANERLAGVTPSLFLEAAS